MWLAEKKLLLKKGFESVDQAPPSFALMVKKFGKSKAPSFNSDWDQKQKKCGKGLTIFRSDQCPYIPDAVKPLVETAQELGIKHCVVELNNQRAVQDQSPSAYGVFNVVFNGALLSYHYLLKKEFVARLKNMSA